MPWIERIEKALRGQGGYGLTLVAQPIIPIHAKPDTAPTFHEALLRLVNPDGTLTNAGYFIDAIAPHDGLMQKVDWWVMLSVAKLIRETGHTYAVNAGVAVLRLPYFPKSLSQMLTGEGASTGRMAIEVTEREQLNETELNSLKMLMDNHLIFLDDVGAKSSHFSLFAHLADGWVGGIKVDIYIVRQAIANPRAAVLIESIFGICHKLNMVCVCEGVETVPIWERLKLLSEPYEGLRLFVQGYGVRPTSDRLV